MDARAASVLARRGRGEGRARSRGRAPALELVGCEVANASARVQRPERRERVAAHGGVLELFAVHDLVLLAYFAIVASLLAAAPPSQNRFAVGLWLAGCAVVLLGACVARRWGGAFLRTLRSCFYRAALVGVLLESYLVLRDLLPIVSPGDLDDVLMALDVALFGCEPTLWVERFTTHAVVEYFSFFYFSYFGLNLVYAVLALVALAPGRARSEYALGMALVFAVGQLGYVVVPGHGPIVHLAAHFEAPLEGGMFLDLVTRTVAAGSAMKDIFPSLHTAVPVWLSAFAFRCARGDRRFRLVAWLTAFFAGNIVVSTVVLRWHWTVDVLAGLLLAASVAAVVPRIVAWEERARTARGLPDAWTPR